MSFDKNKPYSEIFGVMENNARYEQDGVYYNVLGEEVGRDEVAPAPRAPKTAARPKAGGARTVGRAALPGTKQVDAENRKVLEAEELAE